MATYTASAAQTNVSGFFLSPPKYNEKSVQAMSVSFTYSNGLVTAGDVVLMIPIMKGAKMLDVQVAVPHGAKAAGGSTLTVNVGDSLSATRYINGADASGRLIRMSNPAGAGYSYSATDTLRVGINTVGSLSTSAVQVVLMATFAFDEGSNNFGV